jgi:hypothetical protein
LLVKDDLLSLVFENYLFFLCGLCASARDNGFLFFP